MGSREMGYYRAQFICTDCSKLDVFLSAYCSVTVVDQESEEADVYEVVKLPDAESHVCQPSGVERLITDFKKACRDGVHADPVRPLPDLYESLR